MSKENMHFKIISIYDNKDKWIGNISINLESGEVKSYLLEGYNIGENKKEV